MGRFKGRKEYRSAATAGKDKVRVSSLRRTMVFLNILVFIIMTTTIILVAFFLCIRESRRLERDQISEDIARVTDAFRWEEDDLDRTVRDWAFWDDTYEFAQQPSEGYIESNLTESTLTGLDIQIMVFLDMQGRVIYAKGVDLELEREMLLPESFLPYLAAGCPLLRPISNGEGVTGLLLLPEGPFLVASEPILTSEMEGPPRGALVMGRILNDEGIERLIAPYHLNIQVRNVESISGTPEWEIAEALLATGEHEVIRTEGSALIHGYTLLRDVYGEPALLLRVTRDRYVYRLVMKAAAYFASLVIGLGLLLLFFSITMLDRSILRRISRLSAEVLRIGEEGETGGRVHVSGNDEIAVLARSINRMMELREDEERRFRSLVEHAQDIVVILDREGTVTYQSPSTGRVLGYGEEGILGKNVFQLIHPEDLFRVASAFRIGLKRPGSIGRHEVRFRRGDGSWSYLEYIGMNLLQDPAVRGMVVNARDITAQVEARERLERINRLFTSLGGGIMDNIERIVHACREILGVSFAAYSRVEKGKLAVISTASGEEGFRVVDPPRNCPIAELIGQDAKDPLPPRRFEAQQHCGECPVGSLEGYGLCAAYPVTRMDRTVGFLSVFDTLKEDLSRDEMETLGSLARAISVEEERLAHESELKDFIDIASHELRHPVTLMKGYAITLRDYWERIPEDTRRELLEHIDRGADRLDLLIRELLDVSRIERGKLDLNLREVPIRPVVERALSEMEARGNRGRFRLQLPPALAPREMDPEKIQRVLIILLENAVNFSPPDTPIEVSAEESDGVVTLSVLDRGSGVPEKDRERIFERFYQVEDVLHHSKSGMGMGLYIAREIVEAHGGRIWYEPRPGGGSAFRFTLS